MVWLANLAALEIHHSGAAAHCPTGDVIDLPEVSRGRRAAGGPRRGRPRSGRGDDHRRHRPSRPHCGRAADDGDDRAPNVWQQGMQIYAAVQPCRSRDVWSYVKELGVSLRQAYPNSLFPPCRSQRAGRIYVDYNQDLAARNTTSPHTLCGRAMPVVATPVTWEEAGVQGPDDLRFSPEEVLNRVAEQEDLAVELLNESRPSSTHESK